MTGLVGTVDSQSTTITPPPTHRVGSIESVDLGAQVILNHQAKGTKRRGQSYFSQLSLQMTGKIFEHDSSKITIHCQIPIRQKSLSQKQLIP